MWKCKQCNEEIEDTFDACWNCGMSKEGQPIENIKEFSKIKKEITREVIKREKKIGKGLEKIKRPTSVTIFSWILIIGSILQLIFLLLILIAFHFDTSKFGFSLFLYILSVLIDLVVAFGMREGENWSRLLYLWLKPISIIYGFTDAKIGHVQPLFSLFFYIIILIVFTRPNVILYFKKGK